MNFDTNIEVLARQEVSLVRWQDAAQGRTATETLEGLSETLGQQRNKSESFDSSHDGHRKVFDVGSAVSSDDIEPRKLQLEASSRRARFYKPSKSVNTVLPAAR